MLVAWQTLNAVRRPASKTFTRGFIICTPGITIRDRLRVVLPIDPDNYYQHRDLVPKDLLGEIARAKIVITNYHAFKLRERLEVSKVGRSLLKGRGPDLQTTETEGQMLQRVMPDLMGLKNVLVINDEAHHCYRHKTVTEGQDAEDEDVDTEDQEEAEKNSEAARLWISGIEAVKRHLGVRTVFDLSATPFFLRGSGYAEGTLFPWTVCDFSLMDAIECGIVKLPRVPVADNVPSADVPTYRELWAHIGKQMAALVGGGRLPLVDRLSAGIVLGKLGDPRPGVGLTKQGVPDIDWIEIPAGTFWMGDKEDWCGKQRFQCKLLAQPYRIARYPVTVTQFQAFVDAGGYRQAEWWTAAQAAGYWKEGRIRSRDWSEGGAEQWCEAPGVSGEAFRCPNSPVVDVNWFEALAFCRWLSEQLGCAVYLPSEAQWERAARHTDGRLYPWGDSTNDVSRRCNMGETGIGHPSAVGMFPEGQAKCGALDMAGNVWEWCRTKWREDYADYECEVDDTLEGDDLRVLRGGSFGFYADRVRCASRLGNFPDLRYSTFGFRVVVSPF